MTAKSADSMCSPQQFAQSIATKTGALRNGELGVLDMPLQHQAAKRLYLIVGVVIK